MAAVKEHKLEAKVGEYRLDVSLGTGGFGTAYRAINQKGLPVALKIYDNPTLSAIDRAECLTYLSLPRHVFEHSGLVQILDHGEADGMPYVVTELAPQPMHSNMTREDDRVDLTWKYVKSTFIQVLAALQHLHKHEIIHGDVKSDNIVGGKLIDYDTMRKGPTHYMEGPITSTLQYLAPEETRRLKTLQTDVHHATAALYETLFAQTPLERALDQKTGTIDVVDYLQILQQGVDLSAPEDAQLTAREIWNWIFQQGMHEEWAQRPTAKNLRYRVEAAIEAEMKAGTPIYKGTYADRSKPTRTAA